MSDLRTLLESEELKSVLASIDALRLKAQPSASRPGIRFHALALDDEFKFAEVISILLSDEPYFPGLKRVLAAGLAGCLLDERGFNAMRFDSMSRAAMDHMDNAQTTSGLGKRPWDLSRDILARYVFTSTEFLDQIWDELGGYTAFRDASNHETASIVVNQDILVLNTVVRALVYFHHGAIHFEKGNSLPPSLSRAVLIFAGLRKSMKSSKYVSRSLLHKRWTDAKPYLALIYAAESITVGEETLFQIIISQKFSYDRHKKFLNRWVSRARYVSRYVFACAPDKDLQKKAEKALGSGPVQAFSPPPLTSEESALLEASLTLPHLREQKIQS